MQGPPRPEGGSAGQVSRPAPGRPGAVSPAVCSAPCSPRGSLPCQAWGCAAPSPQARPRLGLWSYVRGTTRRRRAALARLGPWEAFARSPRVGVQAVGAVPAPRPSCHPSLCLGRGRLLVFPSSPRCLPGARFPGEKSSVSVEASGPGPVPAQLPFPCSPCRPAGQPRFPLPGSWQSCPVAGVCPGFLVSGGIWGRGGGGSFSGGFFSDRDTCQLSVKA